MKLVGITVHERPSRRERESRLGFPPLAEPGPARPAAQLHDIDIRFPWDVKPTASYSNTFQPLVHDLVSVPTPSL